MMWTQVHRYKWTDWYTQVQTYWHFVYIYIDASRHLHHRNTCAHQCGPTCVLEHIHSTGYSRNAHQYFNTSVLGECGIYIILMSSLLLQPNSNARLVRCSVTTASASNTSICAMERTTAATNGTRTSPTAPRNPAPSDVTMWRISHLCSCQHRLSVISIIALSPKQSERCQCSCHRESYFIAVLCEVVIKRS